MKKNFIQKLFDFIIFIWKSLWKNTIGKVLIGLTILTGLQSLGLLSVVTSWVSSMLSGVISVLSGLHFGVPIYYWLAIVIVVGGLLYWVFGLSRYLKLVSGEFRDDFKEGLGKWNYGSEGWTEEEKIRLSTFRDYLL